jgi:hypothetical protein
LREPEALNDGVFAGHIVLIPHPLCRKVAPSIQRTMRMGAMLTAANAGNIQTAARLEASVLRWQVPSELPDQTLRQVMSCD